MTQVAIPKNKSLLLLAAAMYGPLTLIALILDWWFDLKLAASFTYRIEGAIGYGLLLGIIIVAITVILARLFPFQRRLERELSQILGPVSPLGAVWLALFSGVAEEFLFRGVIQQYTGWVGAGILFGLFHFPARKSFLPWTVFALVIGLLFGWLYDFFPNILLVTIAHFTVNAINLARLGKNAAIINAKSEADARARDDE